MRAFVQLIRSLYEWTLNWAKHPQAAKALSTLSFLEASIFPLPVDPLLLAMGFARPKRSLYYAFLTTSFSVLGALTGYFIGLYAWQAVSPWFFEFVFSIDSFNKVVHHLKDATFVSIFVAGFSPIPFKVFTIAGGVVAAPLLPFFLASLLSRGLRYFILASIIYVTGTKAQQWIEDHFDTLTYVVSALLILSVVAFKFLI